MMGSGALFIEMEMGLNTDRHKHPLILKEGLGLYTCSGCYEYGAAKAYVCGQCTEYTLHEACATIPDTFLHPLLDKEGMFTFCSKSHLRHHCDACGDVMKGFMFKSRGKRLHPYCMILPTSLVYSRHPAHHLDLILEWESSAEKCTESEEKRRGWMYRCKDSSCNLKVNMSCAKADFHGLGEYGIQTAAPTTESEKIFRKAKHIAKVSAMPLVTVGAFAAQIVELVLG
eukprot:Gb_29548 [translate_table: standard]